MGCELSTALTTSAPLFGEQIVQAFCVRYGRLVTIAVRALDFDSLHTSSLIKHKNTASIDAV